MSGTLGSLLAALAALAATAPRGEVRVADDDALRAALRAAQPGTTIVIAAGTYRGGITVEGLAGTAREPIVIRGADARQPPLFEGGGNAFHLRDVAWIELADLAVRGATGNGLNIDDGGTSETPTRHVTLRRLVITDIGSNGNQDAVKLSGVDDFLIEECTLERWGGGGSGIDMVGCHRGAIESCTFRHRGDAAANGVQTKGGTAEIAIRGCRFEAAGSRAVNLGGSTGLEFFRPPLAQPPHAEARDIVVEHCSFRGAAAPIAFVGVDGAIVRFNTIWMPQRWAIRILQETTAEGFVPCRNGRFERNLVVFRSDAWASGGVNIGGGTEPQSFTFAENWWYCSDTPAQSRPTLPTAEKAGVYGKEPRWIDAEAGDLRQRPDSPAKGHGADPQRAAAAIEAAKKERARSVAAEAKAIPGAKRR